MELILRLSEMVSYILDWFLISVLIIAAIVGLFRPWRNSGVQFLIKVISIIVALIMGRVLSSMIGSQLMERINISLFLPEEISSLGAMYVEKIVIAIIFLLLAVLIYLFVGSFLMTFNKVFKWDSKLLEMNPLPKPAEKLLGVLFSILNVYPYLLAIIITVSFPLFGIVREGKLSYALLNGTPIVSSQVARFNQPFAHLQDIIDLVEGDIQNLVTDGQLDFEGVADMINEDPARAQQLRGTVLGMFPELPTEYVQMMDDMIDRGDVTPAEIEAKLDSLGGIDYILSQLD